MHDSLTSLLDALIDTDSSLQRQRAVETLRLRLKEVDHELSYTKNALCDLIQALQQGQQITPQMQAIIDRYDKQVARLAHVEAMADTIVDKIDLLMSQGKDIEAVRYYHANVGAIWDRCHEVIGWWKWGGIAQKREEVKTDLRRAMAKGLESLWT